MKSPKFVADVIAKDPKFASSIVTAFTNLHKPPIQFCITFVTFIFV